MKKLIAVSIILALFASFAVAQEIGLSTWSQAVFIPLAIYDHDDDSDTDNAWSSIGPYWSGPGQIPIRVNTTLAGSTDFAGFQIDLSYDGQTAGNRFFTDSDNVKLWIKPISMLKLTYGKMKEDDLRGKIGDFSTFAAYGFTSYPWGVRNQDTIFKRFEPNHGFHIALTPIDGLYIGTSVDMASADGGAANGINQPANGDDVWADRLQAGVGYTIANIGLARAQYVPRGDLPGASANDGRIEAAFAFTGVEGLTVDVGFKIPLYFDDDDGDADGRELFQFAVGGDFAAGDFGITGLVNAIFFSGDSSSKYTDVPDFYIYLRPFYNLGAFKVGADLGFDNKVTQSSNGSPKGAIDIGAWIEKSVAGGALQVGVLLGVPFDDTTPTGNDGQLKFSVPVSATVSF